MLTEIKRKLFHLTALMYVVGIIYMPRPAYVGLIAAAFVLVLAVETLRLRRPAANAWFQARFGGLFRPEERERMSGVIWMLAGVLTTAVLLQPRRLACAALLYVVLGDGVASLAGKGLGGPRWPGSQKRLSGSAACFVVCVAVGAALLPPAFDWRGVLVGAFVATALEWGVVPGNDNFTIPAGASLALALLYGLRPLGF